MDEQNKIINNDENIYNITINILLDVTQAYGSTGTNFLFIF